MKIQTEMIHYKEEYNKNRGAVVSPIYQNSLFVFEDWDDISNAYDNPTEHAIYTRGKNHSVSIVEEKIAKLCGGEKARLFGSGMAAISSAILSCVKANDHIITLNNIYGPANNFINIYLKEKCQIESTFISGTDIKEFEKAIRPNTTLIYLESPTSAIFTLQDIPEIVKLARKHNIKTIIDNTWATPIFQKPLAMGVDLEVHSCSKYLGGHSDIISGVIVGKKDAIDSIFSREAAWLGGIMPPFESWLLLRSLRTLKLRMEMHCKSSMEIARFLEAHPAVERVNYPGLESFEQHELAKKLMTGFTGLLSIQLKTNEKEKIKSFIKNLKYFCLGVSWGGHESLVYAPAISYEKEMTAEQLKVANISYSTLRLSIGLEDTEDLIDDLKFALDQIME